MHIEFEPEVECCEAAHSGLAVGLIAIHKALFVVIDQSREVDKLQMCSKKLHES